MKLIRCDVCGEEAKLEARASSSGGATLEAPTMWDRLSSRDLCGKCVNEALKPKEKR